MTLKTQKMTIKVESRLIIQWRPTEDSEWIDRTLLGDHVSVEQAGRMIENMRTQVPAGEYRLVYDRIETTREVLG